MNWRDQFGYSLARFPFTSIWKEVTFFESKSLKKVSSLFEVKESKFSRGSSKKICPLGDISSIPINVFFCSPLDNSLTRLVCFSSRRRIVSRELTLAFLGYFRVNPPSLPAKWNASLTVRLGKPKQPWLFRKVSQYSSWLGEIRIKRLEKKFALQLGLPKEECSACVILFL